MKSQVSSVSIKFLDEEIVIHKSIQSVSSVKAQLNLLSIKVATCFDS